LAGILLNIDLKSETELVMMKKKFREQQESNKQGINEPTENKEHGNRPENITGADQESSDLPDSMEPAAVLTNEETSTADKVVFDLKSAEEKLSEMQDRYVRLSAEFDNYRKRTLREKMELSKFATDDLLFKIIPLMDDFDRALAHMETATDIVAMKDGIDLIYNKFSDFLKQSGIREIESMNKEFNVDLHDAIAKIPVQEEELKGKVIDVVQKGYYIYDKVLRHSKVVVGE
jgi:molecular chaperone GrpE